MKKLYSLSAGVIITTLLALSSCSNSNEPQSLDTRPQMSFSVQHPDQEAVHTRATATTFEAGDRIGLFVTDATAPLESSGNVVNNATLSYGSNGWSTEKPIYWDNGTYNVYAYYPYTSPITSADDQPFSVSLNQEAEGAYEASDFLWASKSKQSAGNTPVALQFKHRMSRIYIKLVKGEDYEGDLPDDAEVVIHSTVPTATVDLSVGIVTRNSHGTAASIRAKSLGDHKYAAIIVPQRLDNRQPLVEVIMKGVSYLYESKFLFKPGVQHAVQLAVSKNPEQVKIEIGGEVEKWGETEE